MILSWTNSASSGPKKLFHCSLNVCVILIRSLVYKSKYFNRSFAFSLCILISEDIICQPQLSWLELFRNYLLTALHWWVTNLSQLEVWKILEGKPVFCWHAKSLQLFSLSTLKSCSPLKIISVRRLKNKSIMAIDRDCTMLSCFSWTLVCPCLCPAHRNSSVFVCSP